MQHRISAWSNSRTFCVPSVKMSMHLLQINSIYWSWFRVQQQTGPLKRLPQHQSHVIRLIAFSAEYQLQSSYHASFCMQCKSYFQKTVNGGITFTLDETGTSLPQLGWCYNYISVFKSRLQLVWHFGSSLYQVGSTIMFAATSIFSDITPCSLLKTTDVSEQYVASTQQSRRLE